MRDGLTCILLDLLDFLVLYLLETKQTEAGIGLLTLAVLVSLAH